MVLQQQKGLAWMYGVCLGRPLLRCTKLHAKGFVFFGCFHEVKTDNISKNGEDNDHDAENDDDDNDNDDDDDDHYFGDDDEDDDENDDDVAGRMR